jgi:predicted TIM-barrel fold metal-dependent hydrolase
MLRRQARNFCFETALENQLALVCHTGSGVPYALPSTFMPAARKYPELKIVMAHAGGGGLLFQDAIVAAMFCPNIYWNFSTLMPTMFFVFWRRCLRPA